MPRVPTHAVSGGLPAPVAGKALIVFARQPICDGHDSERLWNCDPGFGNRIRIVETGGRLVTELNVGEYSATVVEPGEHTYFAQAWWGKCLLGEYSCYGALRAEVEAGEVYFATLWWQRQPYGELVSKSDYLDFVPVDGNEPNLRQWLASGGATRVDLLPFAPQSGLAQWNNANIAQTGAKRWAQRGGPTLGRDRAVEW